VTVSGTESSLILDIVCPHLGQTGWVAGTVFAFGKTESMFFADSTERKLATYGSKKCPPQLRHSSIV